jgi:hypothetical protein
MGKGESALYDLSVEPSLRNALMGSSPSDICGSGKLLN